LRRLSRNVSTGRVEGDEATAGVDDRLSRDSTRKVPSRASEMSESASSPSIDSGDATWSTYSHPAIASSHPLSLERSTVANSNLETRRRKHPSRSEPRAHGPEPEQCHDLMTGFEKPHNATTRNEPGPTRHKHA
jgi:hypothetical protein